MLLVECPTKTVGHISHTLTQVPNTGTIYISKNPYTTVELFCFMWFYSKRGNKNMLTFCHDLHQVGLWFPILPQIS